MTPLRPDEFERQSRQIDELVQSGALTAEQAAQAKARLGAVPAGDAPEPPPPRASARLRGGLLAFVLVLTAGGYAVVGTPQAWRVGPGDAVEPAEGAASPHATPEQTEAMLARVAERLREKPDDPEGWALLGRAYLVVGRHQDAAEAFKKLAVLRPGDAQVLADQADALAMAQGRKLAGEPARLIEQALKLDPNNLKALALAGTIAFDNNDYATAARHWELAASTGDPQSDLVRNLLAGAAEARQRGGLPASTVTATAPPAAAAPTAPAPAASGAASLAGRVALSPALKAQAGPDDTVFIFARPAEGSRMPLALLRKQVKDLPLQFTLDDSMAMSPAARLSTAGQPVVVGARISKSGNAMAQPGDLQGFSKPVAVGSRDLAIEIADVVK